MNLKIDCKLKCENKDQYAEMYIVPDNNGCITFNVIVEAKQYDFSLSSSELEYVKEYVRITKDHESACNKHGIWKEGGSDEAI